MVDTYALFLRGKLHIIAVAAAQIGIVIGRNGELPILKNMGYPTQDAEGLIAFAKKNQSTNA